MLDGSVSVADGVIPLPDGIFQCRKADSIAGW